MGTYFRLLRLEDQYIAFGAPLAAGILLNSREQWIILWAIACTCISIGTFILNELVDRKDVDRNSWNPAHIGNKEIHEQVSWALCILFTFFGLILAWYSGLFWWALFMTLWYGLYSTPPIRLKARAGLDILTQIGAGWVIPFGVPFFVVGTILDSWTIILALSVLGWSIIFPYQLADFTADKKAGFRNTHILLGINTSLWLNIGFILVGYVLFFGNGWHLRAPWLLVIPIISIVVIFYTKMWLRLPTEHTQELAFRSYVRLMKPLTQLILPYTILLWFV